MTLQELKSTSSGRKLLFLVAAFAAVYLIWGSTYLAIKYAIETIPTFLMAAARFMIAGGVLLVAARMMPGYERPKIVHCERASSSARCCSALATALWCWPNITFPRA